MAKETSIIQRKDGKWEVKYAYNDTDFIGTQSDCMHQIRNNCEKLEWGSARHKCYGCAERCVCSLDPKTKEVLYPELITYNKDFLEAGLAELKKSNPVLFAKANEIEDRLKTWCEKRIKELDFALYWDRALMTDEERDEHDRLEMERTERFKKLFPASDMTQEVLYKNSKMENKNQ